MKGRIRTYADLEQEKLRLEGQLVIQRDLIRQDLATIREELKPVRSALTMVSKFFSKDKSNPLLNLGVDLVGDVLLKNVLFSRAGFLTRQVAPWLLKNFSTHLFHENGGGILDKISETVRSLTSRFRNKAA